MRRLPSRAPKSRSAVAVLRGTALMSPSGPGTSPTVSCTPLCSLPSRQGRYEVRLRGDTKGPVASLDVEGGRVAETRLGWA